jgi:hypothetical protein
VPARDAIQKRPRGGLISDRPDWQAYRVAVRHSHLEVYSDPSMIGPIFRDLIPPRSSRLRCAPRRRFDPSSSPSAIRSERSSRLGGVSAEIPRFSPEFSDGELESCVGGVAKGGRRTDFSPKLYTMTVGIVLENVGVSDTSLPGVSNPSPTTKNTSYDWRGYTESAPDRNVRSDEDASARVSTVLIRSLATAGCSGFCQWRAGSGMAFF